MVVPDARRATVRDATHLAVLRRTFVEEFDELPDADSHDASVTEYLTRAIPLDQFVAWVVEDDGRIVATGGMVVYERMMRSGAAGVGLEGYVLNVYTLPTARRSGYARSIMREMLEYCAARDIRLTLLATDDGRPLYQGLGFKHDDRTYRWWP